MPGDYHLVLWQWLTQSVCTHLFIAAAADAKADGSEQTNTETGYPFLLRAPVLVGVELVVPPGTEVPDESLNYKL